jgi:ribonuclease PH
MKEESEKQCLRPMDCHLGVLSRSDGSAMFTQGIIFLLYGLKVTIQRIRLTFRS